MTRPKPSQSRKALMSSTDALDSIEIPDSTTFDFESLVGGEFDFSGVDGYRFKLDNVVYEAVEGEHETSPWQRDLARVEIYQGNSVALDLPIARVVVERGAFSDEIYELVDLHDGHCWLCFGTEIGDTSERYARLFTFEYTPKAPGEQ